MGLDDVDVVLGFTERHVKTAGGIYQSQKPVILLAEFAGIDIDFPNHFGVNDADRG